MTKNNLQLMDLCKFIMSFAVISIHCDISSTKSIFCNYVTFVVPLFFIFSGYLMFIKYEHKGVDYILHFSKRLLFMWFCWTVIYFPLTILGCIETGSDFMSSILSVAHSTIFEGKNYMSHHMWYLHSLILYSFLIWFILKKGFSIEFIATIGLVLACIGYSLNYILDKDIYILSKAAILYKSIFITNRILHSLLYISIGLIISKYRIYLRSYNFLCAIIGVSLPILVKSFPFSSYLIPFFLSVFIINTNLTIKLPYKWLRNMSTLIYLIHMYFVALLYYRFEYIYKSGFSVRFIFVSILTFLGSIIILQLSRKIKKIELLY